jgi:enamine deaminase RidA (YjgF/YER057c/UK114 family)
VVHIEQGLEALGLHLPQPIQAPAGVRLPFAPVRVRGHRAFVAGDGPLNPDGTAAGPFGKVPSDVTPEQAYASDRLVCLAMLGSLQRVLGDLDRISAWLRIFGMVNCQPDFDGQPGAINGCSDLILEVFGPEIGQQARSAVGMAALPFRIPVEIEAELEFD